MRTCTDSSVTTVERLSDRWKSAYSHFLKEFDDSLFYYSDSYRRFLEDLLDCQSTYFLACEGDEVAGVLPLMEISGRWGKVINSLPFYGSNGGFLTKSDRAQKILAAEFNKVAEDAEVLSAVMIEHPGHPVPEALIRYNLEDERIGQITDLHELAESESALASLIDSSARRNIRKAERAGVKVDVENDEIEFLRSMHQENMRRIGGRAKSLQFFDVFPRHFCPGTEYDIYVARLAGQPIAALLLFYFNRTVEYYTPVVAEDKREYQPTALILKMAMIESSRRGYLYWNWGGTWRSQEGVWKFKEKWGARDCRYRYFVQVNDRSVLTRTSTEILDAYPNFYVVPFGQLGLH